MGHSSKQPHQLPLSVMIILLSIFGAVLCVCIGVCIFQLIKLVKEKRRSKAVEKEERRKLKEGDASDIETSYDMTSYSPLKSPKKRSSLKGSDSEREPSISSYSEPEFEPMPTIDNANGFLRFREIEFTSVYNHESAYVQVTVHQINLYPVPRGLQKNILLYYVVDFMGIEGATFQSELRPIDEETIFDERYRYHLSLSNLTNKTICFRIFAMDLSFKKEFLFEVSYQMYPGTNHNIEDVDGKDKLSWLESKEVSRKEIREKDTNNTASRPPPELLVSLCYKPTSGRLEMKLLRGKNFPSTAHDCRLRIFARLPKRGSTKSFYTHIIKSNENPEFTESFRFGIPVNSINKTMVVVSLLYGIKGESFAEVGRTTLGPFSQSSSGRLHWEMMLLDVRNEVEYWHALTRGEKEKKSDV